MFPNLFCRYYRIWAGTQAVPRLILPVMKRKDVKISKGLSRWDVLNDMAKITIRKGDGLAKVHSWFFLFDRGRKLTFFIGVFFWGGVGWFLFVLVWLLLFLLLVCIKTLFTKAKHTEQYRGKMRIYNCTSQFGIWMYSKTVDLLNLFAWGDWEPCLPLKIKIKIGINKLDLDNQQEYQLYIHIIVILQIAFRFLPS